MKRVLLAVVILGTAGASGCVFGGAQLAREPAKAGPNQGVVIVVGGIGGLDVLGGASRLALPSCGVPHEVREFAWTHGKMRFLRDLQDTRHFLAKAAELAAEVRRVKEEGPARPVFLVGHSAGAGLVLAAAEQLPPATLERIILLSPAVAPTYDLRPALRACRAEVVSFNSAMDFFMLGLGTNQFGTVDRLYCTAAGNCGFRTPKDFAEKDQELYRRLVQVDWEPEMLLRLHCGLHNSTVMPGFLARYVSPWLKPAAEGSPR